MSSPPTISEMAKAALGDKWQVRRTIWPFKDGYGTFNVFTGAVLDSGLTKEEAQLRADELNKHKG